MIYWANDVYRLGWGNTTLLKFFPDSFYKALHVPQRLAEGMAFHFVFMWLFFLNGFAYILYTIISGAWRELVPNRHSWKEAWLVVLHDLHIRKTSPLQSGKYNAAQKIAYSAIIIMGMGSIITGLAIYKPVQFSWLLWICGGYTFARIIHFILTLGYVLFFVIHVIQVALAGWNNFRAMVAGFELEKIEPVIIPEPLPIAEEPETSEDNQPHETE